MNTDTNVTSKTQSLPDGITPKDVARAIRQLEYRKERQAKLKIAMEYVRKQQGERA